GRPGRENQNRRGGDRLHRAGASQEMTRRVVITGLGTVNPLSSDVPGFWEGLRAGRSGIATITQFDTSAVKVHFGGEVKDFNAKVYLDVKTAGRLDRFAQFAMAAALETVKDSGIEYAKEDPFRCGVIFGSGIGGINEFEDQHGRYLKDGPG